jgi:hypothetical protein
MFRQQTVCGQIVHQNDDAQIGIAVMICHKFHLTI